ncbi:hypothetical protein GGQ74_001701 [Desulfobaculum xiamenense]|uniref:Uncharacterized protein n=1 Tax=Desulfobaculum xiamenense TaxID=995050 RepID=A0A846QIG8_9BACT|nr:hypothetical protein [Desulfobaculum xiamenense]NJB68028.1 hypothetical protein [Desulfobaculum xiamenense]
MENVENAEKSYEESLASDIFNMIQSAKESGLDVDDGFQNEPFATSELAIRYLFYPKRHLMQVPGMPDAQRRKLKTSNILAQVVVAKKLVGIHIIWSSTKAFADIATEAEVLAGIDTKALAAYKEHVAQALRDDFAKAAAAAEAASNVTQ